MIPFMDLKRQYESISAEVLGAIKSVCDETAFVGGRFVDDFEKQFSAYIGAHRIVSTSNGTDALFLAYKAMGLGPGDEVIVPSTTFIATASAVVRTGAEVVFADCDENTWEVDPKSVESLISDRTKAITGVHLYGQPCDIDALCRISEENNLAFIEDCAQAHGARYRGQFVGTIGDIGCFSFYPGKNLGAYGDAGAVSVHDDDIACRIISLRDHGSIHKYEHDEIGYNMRMDGIQAAVLSAKLPHLDSWTKARQHIAEEYNSRIVNPAIKIQKHYPESSSVYHLYVVEVEDRKDFIDYMKENGVSCGIHYPVACHMQPAFADMNNDDLPNSIRHAERCVSLPMFPELEQCELDRVIDLCNGY